jgi:hypothetical protein
MGGKPSKGTPADMRLKRNKERASRGEFVLRGMKNPLTEAIEKSRTAVERKKPSRRPE